MKCTFILILTVVLYSSCTIQRKLYSPTQVNNPSLEKQKDYSVSLSYSAPSGFDLNGGYAITNRLAVIGGLYNYNNKDEEQETHFWGSNYNAASLLIYKHKGFHAGMGIYFPLSIKQSSTFISFFGGYTNGKFEMRESFTETTIATTPPTPITPKLNFYNSRINRWFAQGSLNLYHRLIHQSFITRFNYVGYKNVVTDYNSNEQYLFRLPSEAYNPKWSSFLDFSFDTKIFFSRKQQLGLQLFGTVSTRLNREDFSFYHYPFRGGIGIVLKSPYRRQQKK